LVAASPAAYGDSIVFTLNTSTCSGNCTVPAGTVTLTDTSAGVQVEVQLASGTYFSQSTGAGPSFAFTADPDFSPGITGVSSDNSNLIFSVLTSAANINGNNGTFNTAIQCTNCSNSGPNYASNLIFTVTGTDAGGASITASNFLTSTLSGNSTDYYFAVDVNQGGTTGLIYAQGPGVVFASGSPNPPFVGMPAPRAPAPPPAPVPEPSTLLFLGTGLTALGGILRHKLAR